MDQQETIAYDKDTLRYIMEGIHRGTVISDRYEVIEELGGGGMGTVYKVFDQKVNEKVALKLIRPEIAFDTHTIERFNNELRLARKVTHRNICRLYDLGEHGKLHFITMEYVAGQDLKRMIRMTRELSVGTAVAIGRQICEGLVESHRLGVVHRDLKPQNIMIDNDGNVKVMDFGIARSLYSKGVTMTGVLVGTPEYMAPEQAEASDVDHRADIYAMGVILYEMVTGRVPFKGETPLSIAIKHREESPVDPCEFNAQVSEDLCHVILRCLEKDKANRYQSAEDLLKDLSNIEQGIPTMERVIPRSEKKTDTKKEITVSFKPRRVMASAGVVWKVSRDMKRVPDLTESRAALRERVEGQRESRAIPETDFVVVPRPPGDEQLKAFGAMDFSKIIKFSEQYFGEGVSEYQKAQGIMRVLSFGTANILKLLSEEDVEELERAQGDGGQKAGRVSLRIGHKPPQPAPPPDPGQGSRGQEPNRGGADLACVRVLTP
jgi:serine/threonine protein kinase